MLARPGLDVAGCCGEPCRGAVPGSRAGRRRSEPMAPGSGSQLWGP